jgi:hypothetical protein
MYIAFVRLDVPWFIARGCGFAGLPVRLRAALVLCVVDLVWYVLVRFLLERGNCWVGIAIIASGLLYLRRCCALRLDGKSQVEIIPTCVSIEWRIMPCCIIVARLPTSVCTSMHVP